MSIRSYLRFRLRTLLIFCAVFGALLAYYLIPAYRQRSVVLKLRAAGAIIAYGRDFRDFELTPTEGSGPYSNPLPDSWHQEFFHCDFWDRVEGVYYRGDFDDFELVGELEHLLMLELEPQGPYPTHQIAKLPKLEVLVLNGTGSVNDDYRALAGLSRLRILELNGAFNITDAGVKHLARLHNLQRFRICCSEVSDEGMRILANFPQMTHLDLGVMDIGDATLIYVAKMKELEWLDLGATHITGNGLANLTDLPKLESLNIGMTRVGDAALPHLAKMHSLRHLNLHHSRLSGEGILQLATLTNLKTLDLQNNFVPADDLATLRQRLPDCRIDARGRARKPAPPEP